MGWYHGNESHTSEDVHESLYCILHTHCMQRVYTKKSATDLILDNHKGTCAKAIEHTCLVEEELCVY